MLARIESTRNCRASRATVARSAVLWSERVAVIVNPWDAGWACLLEQIARPPRYNTRSRSVDRHFRTPPRHPRLHDESSSARSPTTTFAPSARSASGWPTRSTPMTTPKHPARPACTPASASSNTPRCAGSRPRARAPARKVLGALAGEMVSLGEHAVDYHFGALGDLGRSQDVTALVLEETTAHAARRRVPPGGKGPSPRGVARPARNQLEHQLVLAVA